MAQRDDSPIGLLESLRRLTRNVQVILSILAVAIGLMAGLAAIGFRYAIDYVQRLGFGFGGEQVATLADALPGWRVMPSCYRPAGGMRAPG